METDDKHMQVQRFIDAAMMKQSQESPKRNYLGASRWGERCMRKLAYEFHMPGKGKPFEGRTLRIFNVGHDGEERMAEYMRLAGFEIITHGADGKQIGFSAADGALKGHIDGAITKGPEIEGLKYPCLWENKMLGKKSFDDLVKKGLEISKPIYYAQMNIYMGYMELSQGLFTAQNRDTCEIYSEVVDFEPSVAQECSDRAVRVVKSEDPDEFSRISEDPCSFVCKFCDYNEICHFGPSNRIDPTPYGQIVNPFFLNPPTQQNDE